MKGYISVWVDREGQAWMDTGELDPLSQEPLIEVLNGEVRGPLGLIAEKFGPLIDLSRRAAETTRRSPRR
jgi:hypothetical protein